MGKIIIYFVMWHNTLQGRKSEAVGGENNQKVMDKTITTMSLPAARYPKIKNALDRKREVKIARMFPTVGSNRTPKIFKIAQRLVPHPRIIPEASPFRKTAHFKIELTPHLLLDRYQNWYISASTFSVAEFLVACTRLYNPLYPSVGHTLLFFMILFL